MLFCYLAWFKLQTFHKNNSNHDWVIIIIIIKASFESISLKWYITFSFTFDEFPTSVATIHEASASRCLNTLAWLLYSSKICCISDSEISTGFSFWPSVNVKMASNTKVHHTIFLNIFFSWLLIASTSNKLTFKIFIYNLFWILYRFMYASNGHHHLKIKSCDEICGDENKREIQCILNFEVKPSELKLHIQIALQW